LQIFLLLLLLSLYLLLSAFKSRLQIFLLNLLLLLFFLLLFLLLLLLSLYLVLSPFISRLHRWVYELFGPQRHERSFKPIVANTSSISHLSSKGALHDSLNLHPLQVQIRYRTIIYKALYTH
jgi:ABC-type transport system involved in multi-copper enzyme maturation permease subunit